MQRHTALFLTALGTLGISVASCTNYTPAKLFLTRSGDTLAVALDPDGASRWNPNHDSLVVECNGCDPENARAVEHFNARSDAQFEIAHSQSVQLTLYTMGRKDTSFLVTGTGIAETGAALPRIRNITPRRRAIVKTEVAAPVTKKAITPEKPKVASLKVTATEGVAVYRDKSKKEVIKIVPQGTTLPLVAREGDLYSVSIDGAEGFVEAEAVQVQD
jgi:hypothetical protein